MSLLDSGRPNVAQVLLSRLSQSDLKVWLQNYAQPYKELMAYYRCAMMAVSTKFEILNEEFSLQYDRNPIEGIKTRLKSPESIVDKLYRKQLPLTVESIEQNINDIAGIRVICSYTSDIYMLADAFLKQDDIVLIKKKDYIKKVIGMEEERFDATIDAGLSILSNLVRDAVKDGSHKISGEEVFKLYDTFGFPIDLTREIALENHIDIDEETFELVQKFISVKKRPNKTGRPNMFVGLVKCPDCGRNMAFSNPNGREPRFRCRTYARNSNLCTTHAISYDALVKIVMDDIQKHIKNMETLGNQFIEEMRALSESGGGKKIKQFKQELELAEKRIAEIDSIIMKLFEQNVAGKISDGRFEKMSVSYENEQRELEERRKALKEKIEAEDYKTKNTNQFLETIRKYENVTELNRSMLVELIDSIYVYQAEGTGKERTQKVEINYRFLCESQCGIA